MKHRLTVLLLAVLVLALAAFTGTAFAGGNGHGDGGGNGNSANAPGHQDQTAPAQAPAAQPAAPASKHAAKDAAKHESKQSSTSAANPATGGSNANGVKPSSSTKHDTYAKASSDQTKKYGNGKTAGQIATAAGYGDATLHGPGNSQPHKVLCGGHEVDVHALKHKGSKCGTSTSSTSTSTSATAAAASASATPQASGVESSTCTATTQTVSEQVLVGVKHMIGPKGSGRFVLIHPSTNSAHFTGKHADDVPVYETVTKTLSVPTGAGCESTQPTVVSTHVTSAPAAAAAPAIASGTAPATASGTAAATATETPAATATPETAATAGATATPAASQTPAAAGGVKGAVMTLKPAKTKPAGGVLGATTRLGGAVASAKLPFTGLSLWIFVLVAAALIGIGATVRRSASRNTY